METEKTTKNSLKVNNNKEPQVWHNFHVKFAKNKSSTSPRNHRIYIYPAKTRHGPYSASIHKICAKSLLKISKKEKGMGVLR